MSNEGSFTPDELDEILKEMRVASGAAGDLLREGLGKPTRIEFKGAVDLVSKYDRGAEDAIRDHLARAFPDIDMLAEETAHLYKNRGGAEWVVDPLDGTTNFLHGHPLFAVSIGLRQSGSVVAGVIAIPALGQTLWARRGGGAFSNGCPIKVSSNTELDKSLIATGFPYDRRTSDDDNTKEHRAFMKRSQGIRRCGAAAVDMAFVAQGIYDGFFEPKLHAWDLAAGVRIIEEAGGLVTDYAGNPIDIFKGYVVASNRHIHPEMLSVLAL